MQASPNPAAPEPDQPADSVAGAPEAAIFRALAGEEGELVGMVAYTLHRRAFFDWLDAFAASAGRAPDDAERRAFLIGEAAPRRLDEYRVRAAALVERAGAPTRPVAPRRMLIWPFGPSLGVPVEEPGRPVNWRGLAVKLLLLLIAVVVTALALRIVVVPSI